MAHYKKPECKYHWCDLVSVSTEYESDHGHIVVAVHECKFCSHRYYERVSVGHKSHDSACNKAQEISEHFKIYYDCIPF